MAGDWIKFEHVTPDKPEVFAIAAELGIDPDAVVGKLVRLWVWADQQTIIGDAPSVTVSVIERITAQRGMAQAMQNAGWLVIKNNGVEFPNFDRHNGKTAKQRALTARRMRKSRDAASVTSASPEKRREENNTPLPPKGGGEGDEPTAFVEFANRYPKKSNRLEALAQWLTLKPSAELAVTIIGAIATHQKQHPDWTRENGRYVPKPDKWLRDRGWEWKPEGTAEKTADDILKEMQRRREES